MTKIISSAALFSLLFVLGCTPKRIVKYDRSKVINCATWSEGHYCGHPDDPTLKYWYGAVALQKKSKPLSKI
jgi:hypothetical protein